MTVTEVIKIIGEVLKAIDGVLNDPGLDASSTEWQQLWNLRKRLDDRQRELVTLEIKQDTERFAEITAKLSAANEQLGQTIHHIDQISETVKAVSTIASIVETLLEFV